MGNSSMQYSDVDLSVQTQQYDIEAFASDLQDINKMMIDDVNMDSKGAIFGKLGGRIFDGYERILYPHVANDPVLLQNTNANVIVAQNNWANAEKDVASTYGVDIELENGDMIQVDPELKTLLENTANLSLEDQRAIKALLGGTINVGGEDILLRGAAGDVTEVTIGDYTFKVTFGEDGKVKMVHWDNSDGTFGGNIMGEFSRTLEDRVMSNIRQASSETDLERRLSRMSEEERNFALSLPEVEAMFAGSDFATRFGLGADGNTGQIKIPMTEPTTPEGRLEAGKNMNQQAVEIGAQVWDDSVTLNNLRADFYENIYYDPSFQTLPPATQSYYVDMINNACDSYNQARDLYETHTSHPIGWNNDGALGDYDSWVTHNDSDAYQRAVEAAQSLNATAQELPDVNAILEEFEVFGGGDR